ncbi:MAG: hypothetical protein BroJett029_36920 [Alphaproteobacteria bacterium]|nr:MAG: hypothetical protein BroJett029_36920 [Alphaproteobacteria bacterium]
MIQASPHSSEDTNLASAAPRRLAQSELEVGLVLCPGKTDNLGPRGGCVPELSGGGGIEIADGHMHFEAQPACESEAGIGGDDECGITHVRLQLGEWLGVGPTGDDERQLQLGSPVC